MNIDAAEAARLARWYDGIMADYAQAAARQQTRTNWPGTPGARNHMLMLRARAQVRRDYYAARAQGQHPPITFTLEE